MKILKRYYEKLMETDNLNEREDKFYEFICLHVLIMCFDIDNQI